MGSVLGVTVRELVAQNAQLEYPARLLQGDPTLRPPKAAFNSDLRRERALNIE
jgi:hypothetical protein